MEDDVTPVGKKHVFEKNKNKQYSKYSINFELIMTMQNSGCTCQNAVNVCEVWLKSLEIKITQSPTEFQELRKSTPDLF